MPTVQLTWDYTQGTAPATKFSIEKAASPAGPWQMIGEVSPVIQGSASYGYADANVWEGETWSYQVYAVGKDNVYSAPSNIATVDIPGVLNAPTNLQADVMNNPMKLQASVR